MSNPPLGGALDQTRRKFERDAIFFEAKGSEPMTQPNAPDQAALDAARKFAQDVRDTCFPTTMPPDYDDLPKITRAAIGLCRFVESISDPAPPARSEDAPGDGAEKLYRAHGEAIESYLRVLLEKTGTTPDQWTLVEQRGMGEGMPGAIGSMNFEVTHYFVRRADADAKDWEAVINDKPEAINAAIELAEQWLSYNDFPTTDTQTHITIICQGLMFLADDAKFTPSVAVADADRFAGGPLVEALEQLAKFGNWPFYGNSEGNVIAREALQKWDGKLRQHGKPVAVEMPPANPTTESEK